MEWILLQAINATGGISADWVLVGITGVAFLLFLRTLHKIEKGLEKVISTVFIHDTKSQLLDKALEDVEEDVKHLKKRRP